MSFGLGLGFRDVPAGRFEDDIEPAAVAEGRDQARGVEPVGAKVVEDRPIFVEQGFGVDQLQGPGPFIEDGLACREVGGPVASGVPASFEVGEGRGPEDRRGAEIEARAGGASATTSPNSVPRCERTTTHLPRSNVSASDSKRPRVRARP